MKRTLVVGLAFLFFPLMNVAVLHAEPTTDEIVTACAKAMGGRGSIDSVRTLKIRYTLPDHKGILFMDMQRPNLNRSRWVVFDGSRLALLDGDGNFKELTDKEEWPDGELQNGLFFPAFFDYPAQYLGDVAIHYVKCHKLGVTLPMGGELTYYIEVATNLPFMVESKFTMHGDTYRDRRIVNDYRESGGILLPYKFTYFSPRQRQQYTVEIDEIGVNTNFAEDYFRIPDGL